MENGLIYFKSLAVLTSQDFENVFDHLGHMLDLYCVRLSNAAPFWENYAELYFDSKHWPISNAALNFYNMSCTFFIIMYESVIVKLRGSLNFAKKTYRHLSYV